jgi:hypothetical protein
VLEPLPVIQNDGDSIGVESRSCLLPLTIGIFRRIVARIQRQGSSIAIITR